MLYKRGEIYYTRFTAKGIRVNRSTGTTIRKKAERYEVRTKNSLWEQTHLDEKPHHTWQEAVTVWIKAKQHKRSLDDDLRKLAWLKKYFNDLPLPAIDVERIEQVMDLKDVSNATRNRYYAVIRGVLKSAHRLGWIAGLPAIEPREEIKKTPRHLTKSQADNLLNQLDTPRRQHLADMVCFSLATGLRESNVTGLTWDRVNIKQCYAYIGTEDYKGKRTVRIPLNSAAMDVLQSRAGIHETHVFSYRGKPVRKANRDGFIAAKKEAGLHWLRWHDLRHTWASWHVMAGTPLRVLKDLGGWADLTMVMRYAHLTPDYADGFAEKVAQNVPQLKKADEETDLKKAGNGN